MYILNMPSVLVDADDENGNPIKVRYSRGEDVSNIRPDQLASLLRLHHAIEFTPEVVQAPAAEVPAAITPPVVETTAAAPPVEWQKTLVADLNVNDGVKLAIGTAGLATVEDVLRYGAENQTLTKITGIGAASEAAIQRAIEALQL